MIRGHSAALLLAALLTACAGGQDPQILRMRSLAVPVELPRSTQSNGTVEGLDRLPRDAAGRIDANILFVHGIGWTQDRSKLDFARDFVVAVAQAYGVDPPKPSANTLCPRSTMSEPVAPGAGLRITDPQGWRAFHTDYVHHRSASTDMACVDRQRIDLGSRGFITIYRVLWDDTLYNAYEFPQTGYDDALPPGASPPPGYEDIDRLRSKPNRDLKTSVVTYGLADAAMYLGPVGSAMRSAIAAAFCAAFDDAAGTTRRFDEIEGSRKAQRNSANEVCGDPAPGRRPAFAIVAESLGSRAVFDVLTAAPTDSPSAAIRSGTLRRLGLVSNDRLEVFLLANQIPLLGVGRLSTAPQHPRLPTAVRFVAVSEINDPLTFELVPYFEHLFMQRCRNHATLAGLSPPDCAAAGGDPAAHFARQLANDASVRSRLLEELGFEVVDVRVRFAGPLSVLTPGFVNPLEAHTRHMTAPIIRDLIVYGADNGVARPGRGSGCQPPGAQR